LSFSRAAVAQLSRIKKLKENLEPFRQRVLRAL
jgi:hypothetical protein